MNINKKLTTINHTAKKRNAGDIKYIVIHYVGALGDAKSNAEYYASTYIGASADFFVGFAGDIWQGNDYYNYYSWHCGGGYQSNLPDGGTLYKVCTNANSIGIEMCVRKRSAKTMNATDKDWYFEDATVNATADLVASLMKELKIDINHVVRHFDVNKKICPNPFVYNTGKYTWDGFKKLCKSKLGSEPAIKPVPTVGASHRGIPNSKSEYVETVGSIAQKLMAETNILASVVAAQCILETGYGLDPSCAVLMKVNNLLGMKTDLINSTWQDYTVWKGKSISKKTPEVYSGKLVTITDSFRVYEDYEECILDYEMFLLHVRNNKGYKYSSVAGMTDPSAVIRKIRIGTGTTEHPEGYCTDLNYETKILQIIKENDLTRFDKKGEVMATGKAGKLVAKLKTMNGIMLEEIAKGKHWNYKNQNTGTIAKTFDDAIATNNRKVNCTCGVYWGLGSGVVGKTREAIQWYGNKGVVFLSEKDKKNALKYFDLITSMKGKTVKACIESGLLKPGDIITYKSLAHTNVYLGNGKSFDSGHANCTGTGEGAEFKRWVSDVTYKNYQIAEVLRLKETVKKNEYRVQSGAYKTKGNAVKRSNVLTKMEIKNDVRLVNGNYVVQIGKYTSKAKAEKFAKDVAAKYKIPVSIEIE